MTFSTIILLIVIALLVTTAYSYRNNILIRGGVNDIYAIDRTAGLKLLDKFFDDSAFVEEDDVTQRAVEDAISLFEDVAKIQLNINKQYIITYVQTYPSRDSICINGITYYARNIANEAIVVGDIHGDDGAIDGVEIYWDKRGRKPILIFTGDYVDKGKNSYYVLYKICSLKRAYPYSVFLCRGNHETIDYEDVLNDNYDDRNNTIVGNINSMYGATVSANKRKKLYEAICKVYATMNLVVIFNYVNMCLHGEFVPTRERFYPLQYKIRFGDVGGIVECITEGDFPNLNRYDADCVKYNMDLFVNILLRQGIVNYIKGHNHWYAGSKVVLRGGINYIVNTSSRTKYVGGLDALTFDKRTLEEKENYESYRTVPTVVQIDGNNVATFIQLRWFIDDNAPKNEQEQ